MFHPIWTLQVVLADNGGGAPGGGFATALLPVLAIFVLFWFLLIRPQRREQVKREQMLKAIKPTDRVITNGGFYGVVTSVDREEGSVVLRIDEANNVKAKVALWAIHRVLTNEPSSQSAKS